MKLTPFKKVIVLFLILLFPSLLYVLLTTGKHNILQLPVFGPKDVVVVNENGTERTDTVYHTIPEFRFTNQYGEQVSNGDVANKFFVADFIFTNCQSICPKMSIQMGRVQEKIKDREDVVLLSYTVDPERDTVEAMMQYAGKMMARKGKWHFLTGQKKALYDLARHGYFITAMEGDGGPEDFIHSEKMVLVDKLGRIRGYYDGTDPVEVDRLIDEIMVLKAEELIPKKDKKQ